MPIFVNGAISHNSWKHSTNNIDSLKVIPIVSYRSKIILKQNVGKNNKAGALSLM